VRRRLVLGLAIMVAGLATATTALAGTINGIVKGTEGAAVSDAVVSAVPVSGSPAPGKHAGRAIMDQQDKEFVPLVLAVQVGTEVAFPNKDNIRHHVYSFSPAKKFELPLYKGTQAAPLKFDKPGVVVLGCNIHDWMLGYVNVLETPYFATTGADGRARIADVPAGAYEIRIWHPRLLPGSPPPSQRKTLATGNDEQVEFTVRLSPDPRAGRTPSDTGRPRQ
jgi:plastocyanin